MSLRSQGSLLLARISRPAHELATEIGVDRTLVTRWISGERKPTNAQRELLALAFLIAPDAWDKEPVAPTPSTVAPTADEPASLTISELAQRIQRQAERSIREIESDPTATPLERDRRLERLTNIVKRLREADPTPQQIVRSSHWRTVVRPAFERVLANYPDAARELADELERLDTDGPG